MISIYEDLYSIPKYINVLKEARKRSAHAAMTITDEKVMDIASHAVLTSGMCNIECKKWNKLPPDQRTCFAWKTTFRDSNYARIRADSIRGESGQPFGEFAGAETQQRTPVDPTPPRDAQLANTMAG